MNPEQTLPFKECMEYLIEEVKQTPAFIYQDVKYFGDYINAVESYMYTNRTQISFKEWLEKHFK